jgi:hypothetical protein
LTSDNNGADVFTGITGPLGGVGRGAGRAKKFAGFPLRGLASGGVPFGWLDGGHGAGASADVVTP